MTEDEIAAQFDGGYDVKNAPVVNVLDKPMTITTRSTPRRATFGWKCGTARSSQGPRSTPTTTGTRGVVTAFAPDDGSVVRCDLAEHRSGAHEAWFGSTRLVFHSQRVP